MRIVLPANTEGELRRARPSWQANQRSFESNALRKGPLPAPPSNGRRRQFTSQTPGSARICACSPAMRGSGGICGPNKEPARLARTFQRSKALGPPTVPPSHAEKFRFSYPGLLWGGYSIGIGRPGDPRGGGSMRPSLFLAALAFPEYYPSGWCFLSFPDYRRRCRAPCGHATR